MKRRLKYLFFIALICWFLVSVFVIYQYLLNTSKEIVYKGGTFVEGIFSQTSILPYLNQSQQGSFYQGMLFEPCLQNVSLNGEVEFKDDLCHVTTTDYQNYFVTITTGNIWSDGVPVTLEDVFFTYNDILRHNVWKIGGLQKYAETVVTQTDDGKLKIEFPEASIDNTLFFTNYILPRHILQEAGLSTYQYDFATHPVYTKCASVMPQSTDQYSLVFDLASCEDTHLGFYQIKDTISFSDFENAIALGSSIVEFYEYPMSASGYVEKKLDTNNIVTLFFNTNSKKTRVRLRRALGGLIKHNFYTGDYQEFIQKPDDSLFDYYASTGGDIQSFLMNMLSDQDVSKQSLLDSNIKQLPDQITITGTNQRLVYFVENISNQKTIEIKFDTKYEKVAIQHEDGAEYFPKSYSKTTKSTKYNLGPSLGNLIDGANKYTIYGWDDKEKKTVATIDVYNLKGEMSAEDLGLTSQEEKLIVLYYREPTSIKVVEHLQKLFTDFDILEYFIFQGVDTADEMEGKLTMGAYDMVINTINMGYKKDFSKLFSTNNPVDNHSQYSNERFVSLLQQYLSADESQKANLLSTVNNIYQTDMPFIFLGTAQKSLFVKPEVWDKMSLDGVELFDSNWRTVVYNRLKLVENISIDLKKAGDLKQFFKFLGDSIKFQSKTVEENIDATGSGENLTTTGTNENVANSETGVVNTGNAAEGIE